MRARCLAWLLHRRTDSHMTTGVGHRINTHVRRSWRQPRRPAIAWTSLALWIAQERSRRPERSCSRTANRKRAYVGQRLDAQALAWPNASARAAAQLPYRSTTVDGAGHSLACTRLSASAAAPMCVGARPVVGRRRAAVPGMPGAHCFAHPLAGPLPRDRAGMAAFAICVRVAFAVARAGRRAAAPADAAVALLDLPRLQPCWVIQVGLDGRLCSS